VEEGSMLGGRRTTPLPTLSRKRGRETGEGALKMGERA